MEVVSGETVKTKYLVLKRIGSAVFYGLASFVLMVVNKTVLTSYNFPSFQVLIIGQMSATVALLYVAKIINLLSFPSFETAIFKKLWILSVIHLGNVFCGFGGTKALSLPMITVLRRFTILMIMIGEFYILGNKPRLAVQLSVYTMILGVIIAASNDLAFSLKGYTFVLLNDLFTTLYSVVMKKKLEAAELGKYCLMFYNSLFMLLPSIAIATFTGDLYAATQFENWSDVLFIIQFCTSCVMGFVLTFSAILCTLLNSALTTAVIGSIKNICVSSLGMFIGGDYVFSVINFVGINVSALGSLAYTWVTFQKPENTDVNLPQSLSDPTVIESHSSVIGLPLESENVDLTATEMHSSTIEPITDECLSIAKELNIDQNATGVVKLS